MQERIEELEAFALSVYEDGLTDVVLAGMGGSSLAPEVLRRTFGAESFHVLDTTHPKAIRALERKLDLGKTLFLVSSKSGSTLETRSHMDYFWEQVGGREPLRRSHRSGIGSRAGRRGARFPSHVPGRAHDRRALLGALDVRARAGGAHGRRPGALLAQDGRDGRGLPARRRQSRARARRAPRNRLAGGARQGADQPEPRRLRALGGAADRGVDGQTGKGPRARAR